VYGIVSINKTVPEASLVTAALVANEIRGQTSTVAVEEVTVAGMSALSVT
jgi:hypothetical protein